VFLAGFDIVRKLLPCALFNPREMQDWRPFSPLLPARCHVERRLLLMPCAIPGVVFGSERSLSLFLPHPLFCLFRRQPFQHLPPPDFLPPTQKTEPVEVKSCQAFLCGSQLLGVFPPPGPNPSFFSTACNHLYSLGPYTPPFPRAPF